MHFCFYILFLLPFAVLHQLVEPVAVRAHIFRLLGRMCYQQNGVGVPEHHLNHTALQRRVKAAKRLVEQQQGTM